MHKWRGVYQLIGSIILLCSLWLSGCVRSAPPSAESRAVHAARIATVAGWTARTVHTPELTITAYGPNPMPAANDLTIYIEGDGLAWISADTPSDNPTLITPTVP